MKNLLLITLATLFSTAVIAQVNTGDAAPGFTYTSLENEEVTLSDFEGKVVYIFFYGASCPHCLDNGPVTEDDIYQPFMEDTNFVALGLDTWNYSVSSNQSFKSLTGISYPLLLNARQSLVDYYGNTSSYDRSVVIAANGTVAYKGTGFVDTDTDQVVDAIETELGKVSTSTEETETLPAQISLAQNYPNPFNPSTVIRYQLSVSSEVHLEVFDMLGHKLATLVDEHKNAGVHTIRFDASHLASGIYIYRLKAGNTIHNRKMTLIK